MIATVGVRELRQNLSKYLERVKRGESLVVTERGREVARLVPSPIPEGYRRAAELFGATIPTARLEEIVADLPPGPKAPAGTTDALLAEMRRDKFE
jgi:prevent-host-death family protein